MDRDQKIGKADDVIVNDGEIGDLISKIDKIHQRYLSWPMVKKKNCPQCKKD
ncbi:MAG: hypothetical protein Ct9H90mP4_11770 [Gammaproteobacteria bacterium]|nr:MAG: hypothetical protein Ct9H90mP4_11770 [Gammaproteobacteria bacterium]